MNESAPSPVYEVSNESGTYHTRHNCPALHRGNRYWLIVTRDKPSPSDRPRGGVRRLCALCAKAGDAS